MVTTPAFPTRKPDERARLASPAGDGGVARAPRDQRLPGREVRYEPDCLAEAARIRPEDFGLRGQVVDGLKALCKPFHPNDAVSPQRSELSFRRSMAAAANAGPEFVATPGTGTFDRIEQEQDYRGREDYRERRETRDR